MGRIASPIQRQPCEGNLMRKIIQRRRSHWLIGDAVVVDLGETLQEFWTDLFGS